MLIFISHSNVTNASSSIELYGSMQIAYEAQSKYLDILLTRQLKVEQFKRHIWPACLGNTIELFRCFG